MIGHQFNFAPVKSLFLH